MNQEQSQPGADVRPNGAGAAAILAAGIGSLAVGLLSLVADVAPRVKAWLIFYKPTGPLSGVTTVSIVAWILIWLLLHRMWTDKDVGVGRVCAAAFVFLGLALLLTFPPVTELF